jgi:hypothetical protein
MGMECRSKPESIVPFDCQAVRIGFYIAIFPVWNHGVLAMPLGIKPTVDFAFKKIFGSPQNSVSLIGLLNAILGLDRPIEAVELLNPFSYQEFAESKLVVLDVRCRDSAGRWLNVEMQVSVYSGLLERLVYYACSMYATNWKLAKTTQKRPQRFRSAFWTNACFRERPKLIIASN